MNAFSLLSLLAFATTFYLAVFVITKDSRSSLNRIFFWYCIATALTAFGEYCMLQAPNYEAAVVWLQVTSFWPVIISFQLHFILIFTEKTKLLANKLVIALIYLPAVIISFLLLTWDKLALDPVKESWGWIYSAPDPFVMNLAISVWIVSMAVFALLFSLRSLAGKKDTTQRKQAIYVFIGVFVHMSWVILTKGAYPGWDIMIPPSPSIGAFLGALCFGYATLRHQLFILTPTAAAEGIVSTMSDALLLVGTDGTIQVANQAAKKLLRFTGDELTKSPIEKIFPGCHSGNPKKGALNTRLKNAGSISDMETFLRAKNGQAVPISLSASLMTDNEGRPVGTIYLARDITERKRAELEKKHLEAQLQQAQKMEAIGTLAGGIAHDFNNLLMGMQGLLDLAGLEGNPDDTLAEYLDEMEEMVKRGAKLTNQLLGFARGGKYEVKPTDLPKLIIGSLEMFGRTRKEIHIHRALPNDLWTVEVDRGQIEQALLNLYVNAWQAMPRGGDLSLSAENTLLDASTASTLRMKAGRYVKISVADTGEGMDKETQKRIFEPFFTTKEKKMGVGLGLASTYGIIKNHGGLITVRSELEEGTTFTIFLPASEKPILSEKELSAKVLTGTETILLVDDEEMILNVGEKVLSSMGYTVLRALSGEKAIELYQEQGDAIDLVILDMIMPGIGGGETFDRLRTIDPHARVLLSSGYSVDGQATEILQRGCNGFIQKPFDIKKLSQKIRTILE